MTRVRRAGTIRELIRFGVAVLAMLGCADEGPIGLRRQPSVSREQLLAALTDSAALHLDENGQFRIASERLSDGSQITEPRARALAWAYFRTIESTVRDWAKVGRAGAPVANSLHLCPRAYYAESGYEPFAPDVPKAFRRGFGPQWLVGLCAGAEQQIAITVSAEATDLIIRDDGKLAEFNSGDVWSIGVPAGARIPAEPERGAIAVALPGYRVAGAPVLRRRASRATPFMVDWVFPLERARQVRGVDSRETRSVQLLHYSPVSSYADVRPADGNPGFASRSRIEVIQGLVSATEERTWTYTRRADVPYRLEAIAQEVP